MSAAVRNRRKIYAAIHRWCGIVLAVHVTLLAITGSLLVWYQPIDLMLNPGRQITGTGPHASLDRIVDAGRSAIVGSAGCSVDTPRSAHYPYRVTCAVDGGDRYIEAFVHPQSAAVLDVRDRGTYGLDRRHIVRTVYELHADLLVGENGRTIVGVSGLAFLLMLITGLLVWWPQSRAAWRYGFRVNWRPPLKRTIFDLHRVTGASTAVLLFATVVSGLYLTFPVQIDWIVERSGPLEPSLAASADPAPPQAASRRSWDELRAVAATAWPAGRVTGFEAPADDTREVAFSLLLPGEWRDVWGGSTIVVDTRSAEIVARQDARALPWQNRLVDIFFPLHNGEVFGIAGRILLSFLGISTAFLAMAGLWLWLKRPKQKR